MQLRSVNLGDIVTWDGCDWIVDAHGARGTRLNPVAGGSPVWVDLATISQEESFEHHHADTEHARAARNRVELAMLASEVRQDVLFWLQHVNEVQSGLTDPHDPDAQPRDGYGPQTTHEERVQRKLAELDAAGIKLRGQACFGKSPSTERKVSPGSSTGGSCAVRNHGASHLRSRKPLSV